MHVPKKVTTNYQNEGFHWCLLQSIYLDNFFKKKGENEEGGKREERKKERKMQGNKFSNNGIIKGIQSQCVWRKKGKVEKKNPTENRKPIINPVWRLKKDFKDRVKIREFYHWINSDYEQISIQLISVGRNSLQWWEEKKTCVHIWKFCRTKLRGWLFNNLWPNYI